MNRPNRVFWHLLALTCLCPLAGACAATKAARVKEGIEVVAKERVPQRLIGVGDAYATLGDATRAAQYYVLAMEGGGDDARIVPRLLEICIRDKQYRAAIYYGQNYLRKHPADHRLRFVLANLYEAMGETQTAKEQIEQVLLVAPDHADAHYALAVLMRDDEGDRVAADRHFRAYLAALPAGAHAEEARASLLKRVP